MDIEYLKYVDRVNDLRKELDPKIESKLNEKSFQWIIGLATIILIRYIFLYNYYTT